MQARVACIVEGHGDVRALPVLLRRIAFDLDPTISLHVPPPDRVPKSRLTKAGEFERRLQLAAQRGGEHGGVFLLLDADDDCPAELGPALLSRARLVLTNRPLAVVIAKHEFEAWFLAAATSLQGQRGLPPDLDPPPDPEGVRGAKEWLGHQMPRSRTYAPTIDQAALADVFDLAAARTGSDSFDKCWREVKSLVAELRGAMPS